MIRDTIRGMLTSARRAALEKVDAGFERFAAWACARGEGLPDPTSSEYGKEKPLIWGYTITDYTDGGPYLTRILFPRVFGVRPMLHKFHRPDGDRALHNHPWSWAFSCILRGSYTEERRLDEEQINGTDSPRTETRLVRWFNKLTDRDFHRVVELHGPVWTLFISGPRTQSWGFDEHGDGHVTDWREYINRKKAEYAAAKSQAAELPETMSGRGLDVYGQAIGVFRRTSFSLSRKGVVNEGPAETDEEYRERIANHVAGIKTPR